MNANSHGQVTLTYIYEYEFLPSELNRALNEMLDLYYDYEYSTQEEDEYREDIEYQDSYYNEEFNFQSYSENLKPVDQAIQSSTESDCSICLDCIKTGENIYIFKCFHHFHKECADTWVKQCQTCPLCRLEIECIADNPRRDNSSQTAPLLVSMNENVD